MFEQTPAYLQMPEQSYFCHEQWFELGKIEKVIETKSIRIVIKGIQLINSYGRVRNVYEDGTYIDIHDGKQENNTSNAIDTGV